MATFPCQICPGAVVDDIGKAACFNQPQNIFLMAFSDKDRYHNPSITAIKDSVSPVISDLARFTFMVLDHLPGLG